MGTYEISGDKTHIMIDEDPGSFVEPAAPVVSGVVHANAPAISEKTRHVFYYILVALSALTLLTETLAPVYLGQERALVAIETVAALMSVIGMIAGGLGVALDNDGATQ